MSQIAEQIIEVKPIDTKSVGEYAKRSSELTPIITSMKILDQSDLELANEYVVNIKSMEKEVEDRRKSIVDPLNKAKDAVQALFKPVQTGLENLRKHADSLIVSYTEEQERIANEEQERIDREALASEEKKKKAIDAQIEKASAKGNEAKVEELLQRKEEVFVPRPQVAVAFSQPAGLSLRQEWCAEVVDLKALVKAIAEGRASIDYIEVNTIKLNQQARATKDSLLIPGVKFFCKKTTARR